MVRLCHADDIAEGEARGFDPANTGRDTMFIVRRHGAFYGYRDDCPHIVGACMAWRRHAYLDASGQLISCHGHGALFDIETGICIHGACLGQSLLRVVVHVSALGDVYADGERCSLN